MYTVCRIGFAIGPCSGIAHRIAETQAAPHGMQRVVDREQLSNQYQGLHSVSTIYYCPAYNTLIILPSPLHNMALQAPPTKSASNALLWLAILDQTHLKQPAMLLCTEKSLTMCNTLRLVSSRRRAGGGTRLGRGGPHAAVYHIWVHAAGYIPPVPPRTACTHPQRA